MSERRVGRLLRRRWWLVLAPAVVGGALAGLWAGQRPATYSAEGSYVVQVDVDDAADLARATAALTASDEIVTTYARIARSSLIAEQARERLDGSADEIAEVEVTSSVVPDANVAVIGARSNDPAIARAMAATVGHLTSSYVDAGGDAFRLERLDAPSLPEVPSDTGSARAVVVGCLVGLCLGFGLAAVAERRSPSVTRWGRLRDIIDERSHAHTKRYMQMRLDQEISRTQGTDRTFSIGVLQVLQRWPRGEADEPAKLTNDELIAVGHGIRESLRTQDILGHLGDGHFAAILPDLGVEEARALVQQWRRSTAPVFLQNRRRRDFTVSIGACELQPAGFVGDPDAELIVSAL